jgi:uncharacterized protein YbaA (DUF1428 family)
MTYVDGFLIPVQKSKMGEYRRMARLGAQVWMDHGALDYKECAADDLNTVMPDGKKHPSLIPKMAQARRGETVVFSYIVFRSRAHRDRVNKAVMKDPRIANLDPTGMPVDMERFGYAGFKAIVEAGATAGGRLRPARKPRASTRTSAAERRMERLPLSGRPF